MNSMHKLNQQTVVSVTSVRQARRRKVHAWLRVTASLSEQVAAELRDISELQRGSSYLDLDLERAMALAERLAVNSSIMHDTFGTLFDSAGESEDDLSSEEDTVMGDQDGTLGEDMASVKRDVAEVRVHINSMELDITLLKSNYATKSDVAEAKLAMIFWCMGTMTVLSIVVFAVARLVH